MPFSHISCISIGFAAAILSLGLPRDAPGSPLAEAIIAAMLPRQSTEYGCGYAVAAAMLNLLQTAACLAEMRAGKANMAWSTSPLQSDEDMARAYGKPPPLSLADIEILISGQGIDAAAFRTPRAALGSVIAGAPAPLIFHIGGRFPHFILAIDARGHEVLLFDPASGLSALNEAELEHAASGYCLVPGGTVNDVQYRMGLELLKAILWRYAQKQESTKAPISTSRSKSPRCSGMFSIFLS